MQRKKGRVSLPCSPSCLSPLPPPPIRVMYKAAIRLCLCSLLLLWPPPPPLPPLWLVMDFHRLPFIPPLLPDYLILAKVKKKKGGSPFFSPPQPRSSTAATAFLFLSCLRLSPACLMWLSWRAVASASDSASPIQGGRMKKKQAGKQGGRGRGSKCGYGAQRERSFWAAKGRGKGKERQPGLGGGFLVRTYGQRQVVRRIVGAAAVGAAAAAACHQKALHSRPASESECCVPGLGQSREESPSHFQCTG